MKKLSFILLALFGLGIFYYTNQQPASQKKGATEVSKKSKPIHFFSTNHKKVEKSNGLKAVKQVVDERTLYEQFLSAHEYNNRTRKETVKFTSLKESETAEESGDNPDLAFEQDYLRTMDPEQKRPTPELLSDIMVNNAVKLVTGALMGLPGSGSYTSWAQRGPSNVGGRTRAIEWDPNDLTGKKVWAGGVSGGLWYNTDITNVNNAWINVGDLWSNLSVTKIAFDPTNPQIMYVSTGEGYGTSTTRGAGIWKSTDAGTSWLQLTATKDMTYINDLVVRNESGVGVVYAAVDGQEYKGVFSVFGNTGLFRSIDGGNSWNQVLPMNTGTGYNVIPYTPSSISIGFDNRLWVGTKSNPYYVNPPATLGGGNIFYSDNGTTWTNSKSIPVTFLHGRVTVATAPSNANYVYAFIEKNTDNTGSTIELIKSTDKGVNWTNMALPDDIDNGISAADFSRGQAWYDQVIKVDPNDPQTLYVGAIDLFKSTNEGSSWTQISKWSNNPGMGSIARLSYVHADQHAMSFKPGSSTTAVFGNDGGVFYSTDLTNAVTSAVIDERNYQYNVTQFYAAAIHPTSGRNYYLAGSQDNGTQAFNVTGLAATSEVTGGDGAYSFIDQVNPNFQITSYVKNVSYLSTDAGSSFNRYLINDQSTGSFINPACYDNNLHIYYSYKSTDGTNGSLYKVAAITTTPSNSSIAITGMSSAATAFKISPYTTSSTTMFIGTASGKLLKVTNANTTPVAVNITGSSFPVGSVSSIDIGVDENELLVTFFNYGVNKIWHTIDGGVTWINKMGDFPNIPARWGMFNANNRTNDVVLATELGIYGTTDFSSSAPTWTQLNNGFANVRTDMLQYRSSDNQVIAATYGRGLYSSMGFVVGPTITSFTPTTASTGTTVTITGGNFSGTTSVSFGGVAASTFTVTSATSISAVVGAGASGNVSVVNSGGQAISPGFVFCTPATVALSSGVNSNNQTVCQNTSIVNITFATTNITGGSTLGLPPGLTASLSSNVLTISGSPTTAGTYSYTINLIGGCQTIIETGTITVTASNTIILSSATGTNAQTACINSPIANITYATTGATGAVVTGLPTGVSNSWSSNVLTISGTPTAAGVFTYTVNLIGGCSSATTVGTINVSANSVAGTASASSSIFCSGNATTLSLTGNTGSVNWQQSSNGTTGWVNVTTGTGATSNTYTTTILSTSTYYRALVTNGSCASIVSNALNIIVNEIPAAPEVVFVITCKDVSPITLAAKATTGNSLLWYGTNSTGGTGSTTTIIANTSVVGEFNYYVSQISTAGCESPRSKLAVTVNAYPAIPDIIRDAASNLVSSSTYGNRWYKDLVLITDTTQSIKPAAAGSYTIIVTQNYCVSKMSSAYYYVNTITDVVNLNLNEFIKVYPNPIVNDLKVDFVLNKFQKVNINIYSTTSGNRVIHLMDRSSGSKIDFSNLPSGAYVVIISSIDNQVLHKQKVMKF